MLALASCHKSSQSPSFDFGLGDGFSHRDSQNLPNGSQDPTDWTTDATWNAQEKALFSDLGISLDSPQQPDFIDYTAVYSNPATNATWLVQSKQAYGAVPPNFLAAAVIVRSNYQLVLRLPQRPASKGSLGFVFDYAKLGLQPGEMARLYYVLFDTSGLLYKGHGDIRFAQ
ncbi:hypothetical protein [Hymenobacter baengnokdamensis]|uniref:hypothetical protein n=1 Tax=Hymenobacter baengnokdamensis TaxID=2615203 RepID=UPI00177F1D8C|nr:hypothetical protein [Hymenobacter baengnokdamensis]